MNEVTLSHLEGNGMLHNSEDDLCVSKQQECGAVYELQCIVADI